MARGSKSVWDPAGRWLAVVAIVCTLATPGVARAQGAHRARSVSRTSADAPAQPVITLERTACRGQCAEYKLAFYEDGQVVYDGMANASKAGRWYARVPRATVEDLASDFRRIGYDTLATKYPPGLSESPIAMTTLRVGARVKSVTHEEGSPFPPPDLSVLEDRLDAAVQSVDWVK